MDNNSGNGRKFIAVFIVEGIIILFLLADVLYINLILSHSISNAKEESSTSLLAPFPTSSPIATATPVVKTSITITSAPSPSPSATPTPKSSSSTSQQTSVKDYFIPLGSGSVDSTDWADVPGARASVDFGQYPSIKSIVFEASVSVPTGNQAAYVRLFNVTDAHPVWYSDVTMSGGTSAYLVSTPVTYDTGLKTYQVQMKTQLNYTANLTQGRIHITIN